MLSDRKRHLKKDKTFTRDFEALTAKKQCELSRQVWHVEPHTEVQTGAEADALLSTHFAMLTERFLTPLNRYFTTLLPPET